MTLTEKELGRIEEIFGELISVRNRLNKEFPHNAPNEYVAAATMLFSSEKTETLAKIAIVVSLFFGAITVITTILNMMQLVNIS